MSKSSLASLFLELMSWMLLIGFWLRLGDWEKIKHIPNRIPIATEIALKLMVLASFIVVLPTLACLMFTS